MADKKYDIYVDNRRVGELIEQTPPEKDDSYKYDLIISSAERLSAQFRCINAKATQNFAKEDLKSDDEIAKKRTSLREKYLDLENKKEELLKATPSGQLAKKLGILMICVGAACAIAIWTIIIWGGLDLFGITNNFVWWPFSPLIPLLISFLVLLPFEAKAKNKRVNEVEKEVFNDICEQSCNCYNQLKKILQKSNCGEYIYYYINCYCEINEKDNIKIDECNTSSSNSVSTEQARDIINNLKDNL